MPCQSYESPSPSEYDKSITETVKNLIYAQNQLGVIISNSLTEAYSKSYFDKAEGDKWTKKLCELLTGLSKKKRDELVYNPKSAKSRRLADWWEEHQRQDKERVRAELKKAKEDKEIKTALAKLTAREKKLLNL